MMDTLWALFNVQDSFNQNHDKILMQCLNSNSMALIDSGASKSAFQSPRGMNNVKRVVNGFISAANGQRMIITHIGGLELGVWNSAGLEDVLKLFSVIVVPEVKQNIISTAEVQRVSVTDDKDRVYYDTLLRMKSPVLRCVDRNGLRIRTRLDVPVINGSHSWLPIAHTSGEVGGVMVLGSTNLVQRSTTHPMAFRSMIWNPETAFCRAINVMMPYTNLFIKGDVIYINQEPTKSNYITHESMGKLFDEPGDDSTKQASPATSPAAQTTINALFNAAKVKATYTQAHEGFDHALDRRRINRALQEGYIEGFYLSDNTFDSRGRLTNKPEADICEACQRMKTAKQQTLNERLNSQLGTVDDGGDNNAEKKLGSNQYSKDPGGANKDPSKRSVE